MDEITQPAPGSFIWVFHGATSWHQKQAPSTMADPAWKTLAKAVFVVVLFHCVKDNWPYEDEIRHFYHHRSDPHRSLHWIQAEDQEME